MSTNVDQIKEKLDIVDVISAYLKVEKAGVNFKAKCPFHQEKSASFFISPTRQSFYCFGCGEKGDIFSFVEKFENIDFKEALNKLADQAGIKLEKFQNSETNEKVEAEKVALYNIMEEATKFYENNLPKDQNASSYLQKRGLTNTTIKDWRLGFALDEWRSLSDFLSQKGFDLETMFKAGLIKKASTSTSTGQTKIYDTFRNRIVFPICDPTGRVIAFSGRAMQENDKTPKYLNSPETKLFYKSETLHGFNVAKNYIRKLDYAVLVEGQMDLLMSHQLGIYNTVASSGTALTELHLRKIQKLSNRLIIAYDGDLAGIKAGSRAAELALNLGMETKIATFPENEDPASIIKKDPKIFRQALKESVPFIDFALNHALDKKDEIAQTKEILKNVLPLVNLIKSDIEKSQLVKKIAIKTKALESAVWNDLAKIPKKETENSKDGPPTVDKDREKFIFELEKYMQEGDKERVSIESAKRTELERLKRQIQEIAVTLDDPDLSKEAEERAKEEFEKIQKLIKNLN